MLETSEVIVGVVAVMEEDRRRSRKFAIVREAQLVDWKGGAGMVSSGFAESPLAIGD